MTRMRAFRGGRGVGSAHCARVSEGGINRCDVARWERNDEKKFRDRRDSVTSIGREVGAG